MADLKDVMGDVRQATKSAMSAVREATGRRKDRDLELYRSLKPQHFQHIAMRYGFDETLQYIEEMEKRKNGKIS